jgi:hypothetical protein
MRTYPNAAPVPPEHGLCHQYAQFADLQASM